MLLRNVQAKRLINRLHMPEFAEVERLLRAQSERLQYLLMK